MKFEVIKYFRKRSEGLKEYFPKDMIELSKKESEPLVLDGFVKALKQTKQAKITRKKAIETK